MKTLVNMLEVLCSIFISILNKKKNSTDRRNLIRTLTPPSSLPTLPFDLIPEILSRLPVKQLLQLRCVCKLWKSLISDPKFAKKHLSLSTTYSLHGIEDVNYPPERILKSYSLDSVLIAQTHLPLKRCVYFVGSCNGIFCLADEGLDEGLELFLVQLWNPSIRKFKELPSISKPQNQQGWMYGFGYDPISDKYKVVIVFLILGGFTDDYFSEIEVKVHTLGTNSWKSVSVFPFNGVSVQPSGQYASGTINWLALTDTKESQSFIASLDLGNESYQKVLLPDDSSEVDKYTLHLCVFRDCLCLISGEDVWAMKEYGNKETWTKLFAISYASITCRSSYRYIQAKYVFEDDQVLLKCKGDDMRWKYISYNCKNDTSKFIEFKIGLEVCIESLISPCF